MSNTEFNTSGEKALSVDDAVKFSGILGCFGMMFGFVFSSMFFGMGSLFLWMTLISPLIKAQSAKSWVETPCTIVESFVKGGGNKNSRTIIKYEYTFQDEEFESDQVGFGNTNSGKRADKERLVAKYPKGSQQNCFVNPEFPSESVLNRDANASILFGLFALPFILVGLGGYYATFNAKGMAKKLEDRTNRIISEQRGFKDAPRTFDTSESMTAVSTSEFDDDDLMEKPGPVTLESESQHWGVFIFVALFGLFWNGIIIAVSAEDVMNLFQGQWKWSILFFIPFYLVGIGFMIGMVYCFLSLFNPRATVTLSRQLIPLAGSASIDWVFNGSTRSIRTLKVSLKGEEQATYRRGTDTTTDTEEFYDEVVYETQVPMEMPTGSVEFTIPTDTMHSFTGGNNKIVWKLQVHGDIPIWPDVDESFPIRVVPHE